MSENSDLCININPRHQKHIFVLRVFNFPRDTRWGYSNCSRAKILACKVRNYAVLVDSIDMLGETGVETYFNPLNDTFRAIFVTTSIEKIDDLYEEAVALCLFSFLDPIRMATKTLAGCKRFPLSKIPD